MPSRLHLPSALLRSSRGFTLIELLVAMGIMAAVLSFAGPSIAGYARAASLTGYSNNFAASVQAARAEAVKRNSPVTLCRSRDGRSCATDGDFQQGWIVFQDVNGNGVFDEGDTVLQKHEALSSAFRFTRTDGATYAFVFQPSGVGSTTARLTLCRREASAGEERRELVISPLGRLSVSAVRDGTCP